MAAAAPSLDKQTPEIPQRRLTWLADAVRDALLVALPVALRDGVAVREPEAEHDADTLAEADGDELPLNDAVRELEGERELVAVALGVALSDALALAVMDGLCMDVGEGRACVWPRQTSNSKDSSFTAGNSDISTTP
jgi:hypothetical protein